MKRLRFESGSTITFVDYGEKPFRGIEVMPKPKVIVKLPKPTGYKVPSMKPVKSPKTKVC